MLRTVGAEVLRVFEGTAPKNWSVVTFRSRRLKLCEVEVMKILF